MSKTRYLRKIDDGHLYVWTEALAKRPDMVEADSPNKPKQKPAESLGGEGGAGGNEGEGLDPLAITDRDELKRLLDERGVEYAPNLGLVKLQKLLAESLGGEGE